jgi:probable phosphoglycerate mutase
MLLLLARHGNTFDAGDKVVWVGARTDLLLTRQGRQQAAALAKGLEPIKPQLRRMVAGPLKRTRDFAEITACELGLDTEIHIDERLREIDYGLWEGKSSEEIEALGKAAELKAWSERGVWPHSPGWKPTARTIADNVRELAEDLAERLPGGNAALLVTSNGILKYFLKLVPGAFEAMAAGNKLKVATGNCCALRNAASGWEVVFWDCKPAGLSLQ